MDSLHQCSFRKTRTTGTLATQAENGVWVQAPGGACSPAHSLWSGWGLVSDGVVPSRFGGTGYYFRKTIIELICLFAAVLRSYTRS